MKTTLLLLLTALMMPVGISLAQGTSGNQWAAIISVSQHREESLNNIRFTQNDAQELRSVLIQRGGVAGSRIVELGDAAPPQRQPELKNIRTVLPQFLADSGITTADRVIVYFSGHGVLVEDETYLVPADVDLNNVCLLYTSPSPRDLSTSRMPSSA